MTRARKHLAVGLGLLMAAVLLTSCPSANPPDGNGTPTTFILTVQPVGDGSIESDPQAIDCPGICQATLAEGTTLALIATPHGANTFDGWHGDHDCHDGSVTLTSDTDCTAVFLDASTPSHRLEVDLLGEGSVTSTPAGIDCPAGSCIAVLEEGTVVTLDPTPASGHAFDGWHGDDDCSDGEVTMNAAIACVAAFAPTGTPSHVLDVTVTAGGDVTSAPSGIDCPSHDCYALFQDGTSVELTATADADHAFSHWGGDPDCSDGRLAMDADHACTATFTPTVATYDLAVTIQGSGSVTSSPAGIQCGATCEAAFTQDTVVTLAPTPDGGHAFGGWSGDPDCGDGQVTMTSDRACTAAFTVPPPENQPPDVAALTDQSILIGDDLDVSLTIEDEEPETLAVAVTTSDPSIVSPTDLQVLGTGGQRTLRVTPTPCHAGTTTITVAATDAAGLADAESFNLHVRKPFQNTPIRLVASDAQPGDTFGTAVAIDGDYALVGAPSEDEKGSYGGAAYVFRRTGGGWSQVAKLTADDGGAYDLFGWSIAIDGDHALIGAPGDGQADAGAAYLFRRTDGGWSQHAKLTASGARPGDSFGSSVAIDGDYALIGARDDSEGGLLYAGAAYLYRRTGAGWSEVARLTAGTRGLVAYFGHAVAIDGNYALIGAFGDREKALGAGAAYLFELGDAGGTQVTKFMASDGREHDGFGISVALDGDIALIGAYGRDHGGAPMADEGCAYVYQRTAAGWTQLARLSASDAGQGDSFGGSVALDGDHALVGAESHDVGSAQKAGAAYVFQRCGDAWKETAIVTSSAPTPVAQFGSSVALDDGTALIGANIEDASGPAGDEGAAYLIAR